VDVDISFTNGRYVTFDRLAGIDGRNLVFVFQVGRTVGCGGGTAVS
jgi:hypothetical protein